MEVFGGLIFRPANFLGFVGSHRDFFVFDFRPLSINCVTLNTVINVMTSHTDF